MPLPPGVRPIYVERDDVPETYVDSFEGLQVQSQIARMELCSVKMLVPEQVTPTSQPKFKKIPVARLVMPLNTLLEFYNNLQRLVVGLESQGLIKRESPGAPPTATPH